MTRPERLQRAFDELGDYVHPNYGSHVLITHPQSEEAATTLLEACCAVYEAFLALPWATEPCDDRMDAPNAPSDDQRHPFERLADNADALLARSGLPAEYVQHVLGVLHRVVELDVSIDADARTVNPSDTWVNNDLLAALSGARKEGARWPVPIVGAGDRLRFASLVADEERLVAEAMRAGAQRAAGEHEAGAWLALLSSALTFSINMIEFKLTTLGRDAAWMLVEENVVGAALSVRAMLEHHAVALELGKKLTAVWRQLEKVALKEDKVEALIADAEKQLARVLSATPQSKEQPSEWRRLWLSSVRRYHVLDPVTSINKEQPGFLETYGLLSHIVHGTICTGGDLLEPGGASAVRRQLPQLIVFLANVSDPDAIMDRLAPSAWMAHRLAELERHTESAFGPRIERSRIPEGYKLKPRRDVLGTGTKDDPFRFRRGLLYHEAYYRFLKQEAISVRSRHLHHFAAGFGDEVHTEDGRVIYFLNDTLPVEGDRDETPGD